LDLSEIASNKNQTSKVSVFLMIDLRHYSEALIPDLLDGTRNRKRRSAAVTWVKNAASAGSSSG